MLPLLAIRCWVEKRGHAARYIAAASAPGRPLRATDVVRTAVIEEGAEMMLRRDVLPDAVPHRRRSLRRPAPTGPETLQPCLHPRPAEVGASTQEHSSSSQQNVDAPLPYEQAVRAPGSPGPGVVVRIGAVGSHSIPGRRPPGWKSGDRDRPGVTCRHSGLSDSRTALTTNQHHRLCSPPASGLFPASVVSWQRAWTRPCW
jgi:hypothetical protein